MALVLGILMARPAVADPAVPGPARVERFLELLREASPLAGDLLAPAFRSSDTRSREEGADQLDRLLGAPRTLYLSGKAGGKLRVAGPGGTIVSPTPLPPSPAVKKDWDSVIAALSIASAAGGEGEVDHALRRILLDAIATKDARTHILVGLVRYSRGEAEAVESFEAARRASRNDVPSRILAGHLHLSSGHPEKAVPPLLEALKLAPRNPAVRELLAEADLRVGRVARAIRLLRGLVEAQPTAVRPRLLLVRSLLAARQPQAALDHLAAVEEPETADGLRFTVDCLAARAYLLLGKPEDAQVRARSAAKLRPEALQPRLLMVSALVASDRIEEAATRTRDLVAAFPSAAPAWRLRALVCEKRGEIPLAESAARRWLSLAPDGAEPVLVLSRILVAAGKPDEAVPLLLGVLGRAPRVAAAHRLLGAAHLAAGRKDEARKCFDAFLRAVPRGPVAAEVRKQLADLKQDQRARPK